MKTTLSLGLLFIAVLAGGFFWFGDTASPVATTPQATSTPITTQPGSYSAAQVATHDTATSCWSSINGNVYDLTSWINQHPGGEGAILSICGKDGTSAFENQHGDQSQPNQILATFKIGTLAS